MNQDVEEAGFMRCAIRGVGECEEGGVDEGDFVVDEDERVGGGTDEGEDVDNGFSEDTFPDCESEFFAATAALRVGLVSVGLDTGFEGLLTDPGETDQDREASDGVDKKPAGRGFGTVKDTRDPMF